MAKQLPDLEELFANEINNSDLFIVRDTSSRKDKKISYEALRYMFVTPMVGEIVTLNQEAELSDYYPGTTWELYEKVVKDTGWVNATLQNGWTDYSTEYATAGFRRIGNIVHVRAMVKNGTIVNNAGTTPIFTLPNGFKPSDTARNIYPATSSSTTRARCDIFPTGVVQAVEGTNAFFSIAGISFPCNDSSEHPAITRLYMYRRVL